MKNAKKKVTKKAAKKTAKKVKREPTEASKKKAKLKQDIVGHLIKEDSLKNRGVWPREMQILKKLEDKNFNLNFFLELPNDKRYDSLSIFLTDKGKKFYYNRFEEKVIGSFLMDGCMYRNSYLSERDYQNFVQRQRSILRGLVRKYSLDFLWKIQIGFKLNDLHYFETDKGEEHLSRLFKIFDAYEDITEKDMVKVERDIISNFKEENIKPVRKTLKDFLTK